MSDTKALELKTDKDDMVKARYSKLSMVFIIIPVAFVVTVLTYSYYSSDYKASSHDSIVSDLKKNRAISSDKKP